MTGAESVAHLHAAMLWDFRVLGVLITVQTALIVWLIVTSRRP